MTTTLTKKSNTIYYPSIAPIPARCYNPAGPAPNGQPPPSNARCGFWTSQQGAYTCTLYPYQPTVDLSTFTGTQEEYRRQESINERNSNFFPQLVEECGYGPTRYVWTETAYAPPVPGKAASTTVSRNLGWNAGAFSIDPVLEGGSYEFTAASDAIGIVSGITALDSEIAATGYQSIDYAFIIQGGTWQVIENGTLVGTPTPFSGVREFSIDNLGDAIVYYVDGVEVRRVAPTHNTNLPLHADASLFAADDQITYNIITSQVASSAEMNSYSGMITVVEKDAEAAMQTETDLRNSYSVTAADGTVTTFVSARMDSETDLSAAQQSQEFTSARSMDTFTSMISTAGIAGGEATVSLEPLESFGFEPEGGYAQVTLEPLVSYGESLLIPQYGFSEVIMEALETEIEAEVGVIGSADAELRPLLSLGSEYAYGESRAIILPLESQGSDNRKPDIFGFIRTPSWGQFLGRIRETEAEGLDAIIGNPFAVSGRFGHRAEIETPPITVTGLAIGTIVLRAEIEIETV